MANALKRMERINVYSDTFVSQFYLMKYILTIRGPILQTKLRCVTRNQKE